MYSRCKLESNRRLSGFYGWQRGFAPYSRCIHTAAYFPPLSTCSYPENVPKSKDYSHLGSDRCRAVPCHSSTLVPN